MRTALPLACCLLAALSLVRSAPAAIVVLTTGETLNGDVLSHTDDAVLLKHPVLGELTIPAESVKSVQFEDEPAERTAEAVAEPAEQEEAAPAAPPEPVIAPEPAGWLPDWNKRIEAGFTGSEGNSENNSLRAAFLADTENETDRWLFDAKYYYATSNGDTTDNTFTTGLRKDWLLPDSPWFIFAQGRYDYDQFEAWRHRASGNGGLGYEIFNEEDLALNALFGGGVTKEFSGERELRPEALLGLELLRWKTFSGHVMTGSTVLYPDLGDLGEYRWINALAYTIKIDQDNGLSLKFGVDHEYQSEVAPSNKNHDVKYYGALVYEF